MKELPEVTLEEGTLVIGDLHLDVDREEEVERFEGWLAGAAAPRLVILGDLFEYWIGPAQGATDGGRRVSAALRQLVGNGTAIDVIPGNRDFLLDADFERASGARVRHEGLVGVLGTGERVLFLHGDELATRDVKYQRLRRVIRAPSLRWLARRLPLWLSRAIARRLRRVSRKAVANKPAPETELQRDACAAFAGRHASGTLTCGHAHRFRDEEVPDGPRWLVVDAFGGRRDTLELRGGRLELRPGT